MNEYPKAESITVAKRYDFDYRDGERRYGYGGYRYGCRWRRRWPLDNAKEEVKPFLRKTDAVEAPFKDNGFDFVSSLFPNGNGGTGTQDTQTIILLFFLR